MQNKQKRGFTLIELLAVIVILAIIALIAVPVIMNVITKARKSAFEDSAYGIVKAGEMYYTNKLLEAEGMTDDQEFTITGDAFQNEAGEKLDINGSLPSSGKVTVTKDGKVALVISNGEYYIQKSTTESEVKAKPLKEDNILETELDYKKIANPIFTISDENATIPTCITDNTECDTGTPVAVKVNDEKIYDFYVISEDAEKGTITLIMNQNLGKTVAWVSKADYLEAGGTESDYGNYGNSNKGPVTALKELEDRTSSWTNIPSEIYELTDENNLYSPMTRTARARLITATEANTLLSLSDSSWAHGDYWTSDARGSGDITVVTRVKNDGSNVASRVSSSYGIRPIITVSKTVL